jgi:hypothetical protein
VYTRSSDDIKPDPDPLMQTARYDVAWDSFSQVETNNILIVDVGAKYALNARTLDKAVNSY